MTMLEIDVLKKTTKFLINREVLPYRYSIANKQGSEGKKFQERILSVAKDTGFHPTFSPIGADIVGVSVSIAEWWQVECKGAGSGTPQTQRNSFDRALASVVSYYEAIAPEEFKYAKPYLGLALPATQDYLRELKRRVRKPLRQQLNLWVLLCEFHTDSVRAISPDDEY